MVLAPSFITEWGNAEKIYIILSGLPEHHRKHQKTIKFPITAIHTYVFHSWKTKLKINQDKGREYKCTWRRSQPPKGSSNSEVELTREDFPRGMPASEGKKHCSSAVTQRSPRETGPASWAQSWPEQQAKPRCILNMMALYCQKCLALTFLNHQFTNYRNWKITFSPMCPSSTYSRTALIQVWVLKTNTGSFQQPERSVLGRAAHIFWFLVQCSASARFSS